MTAFLDATKAIIARLTANYSDTDIVYDNMAYDPKQGTPFLYCAVDFQDARPNSIGSPDTTQNRYFGTIELTMHNVINEGAGDGLAAVEKLATIFRLQTFSGVLCYVPKILAGRQVKLGDGIWWMTPLFIPFKIDAVN